LLALALATGLVGLLAFGLLGAARTRVRWPGVDDEF
jgi:hypothetical protein